MSETTPSRCGRMPATVILLHLLGVTLCSVMPGIAHSADDPYLKMLDNEVTKVETNSTDTSGDGAASVAESAQKQDAQPVPSREHFEALLSKQHVGTYSFYRRLPERSREEIFLDYGRGASMEALREKIIDRYLHP